MAHLEHYKADDIKRLANEYTRDENYKARDNRIDVTRTPNNYVMNPAVTDLQVALQKRVSEVPHMNKKTLNVLSSWVVTCPQELKDDEQQCKRFFELTYAFVQDRYGSANVLQGYVHMDESTPHMHVSVVPVKDNRISAKKLFDKAELRNFHKDLDALMEREYSMPGLILNGRTKGGYTTEELKERTRRENALDASEKALNASKSRFNEKVEEYNTKVKKFRKTQNRASEALREREDTVKAKENELQKRIDAVVIREINVGTKEFELEQKEKALEEKEVKLRRFIDAGRKALAEKTSVNVSNTVESCHRSLSL